MQFLKEIIFKKAGKYIIRDTIFTIPRKKFLNVLGMPVNISLSRRYFLSITSSVDP